MPDSYSTSQTTPSSDCSSKKFSGALGLMALAAIVCTGSPVLAETANPVRSTRIGSPVEQPQPQQSLVEQSPTNLSTIAEIAKPAVVRLESVCRGKIYWSRTRKTYEVSTGGSASGFFVNPEGYIATNAHAVIFAHQKSGCHRALLQRIILELWREGKLKPEDYTAGLLERLIQETELREMEVSRTVILPNGDRLPYTVKTIGAPVGEGQDVAIIKVNVKNAPTLLLRSATTVPLLSTVIAIGYPVSANSPVLDSKADLQASFTTGSISARKVLEDGSPVWQFSAPTTHGGSGGPLINAQGQVEGMVTFGGDTETAGYAFAVSAKTIAEFLDRAGIQNIDSPSNQLYQEVLVLYNQRQYGHAFWKLLELQKLFPQHSEVERLLRECREQIRLPQVSLR